jgi:hydrophobic/amphiphilic exporter-1 (mainly G- bacteria), HAE1 family
MNVSALFIRRPVMTTLVMATVLLFGALAYFQLPVSDLPSVDFPTIEVGAQLRGANPETMAAAVATPLEKQFSTISGLDSMTSVSTQGGTRITLQFDLNRDIDAAALDVQSAITTAMRRLPDDMDTPPGFRKVNPADAPILYLATHSSTMRLSDVNEYAENLMAQRSSIINGVAQVLVFGSKKYAVRIELDPASLASKQLGVEEVAHVSDSVENTRRLNWYNDIPGQVLAIQRQPGANTVRVEEDMRELLPDFQAQLPAAVNLDMLYDHSQSIKESVADVKFTLVLTACLVVMVIFLFLRNIPATVIPSLALPLSIVGTFAVMHFMDFSLNNISLMALILAVGFVVDDAIIMLENVVDTWRWARRRSGRPWTAHARSTSPSCP